MLKSKNRFDQVQLKTLNVVFLKIDYVNDLSSFILQPFSLFSVTKEELPT